MIQKLLIAAGVIALSAGSQAAMPDMSAAAAPVGTFLQIAADAGQQVATLVNGEAAATRDPQATNLANTVAAPAVPEPETYALMLAGLAAVGIVMRRRRR